VFGIRFANLLLFTFYPSTVSRRPFQTIRDRRTAVRL